MKRESADRAILAVLSVLLIFALLPTVAVAQKREAQRRGDAQKVKGVVARLLPQLKVEQFGGEFAQWVTAMPLETVKTPALFSWTRSFTADVVSARWQLSDVPLPATNTSMTAPGTLATGYCSVPQVGHRAFFKIDLSKYLPSDPPAQRKKYYIRVVANRSEDKPHIPSTTVTLTYQKYTGEATVFTAEGLEMTVKQKHAWMYKNSPMQIQIDLDKLYVGNENEGGDEPYLLVFVLYVDGTTINPLNFASSTIRIDCPSRTHGNVPDENMFSGDDLDTAGTAKIPNSTGRFEKSIKPIGLEFAADLEDYDGSIGQAMKDNTMVYLVVVAMEEDATKTSAINAARSAALQALQQSVNGAIQSLTLQDLMQGNPPRFDPAQIQSEIKDKALAAAKEETTDAVFWATLFSPAFAWSLAQAVDPDDYVGASYKNFTFGELLDTCVLGQTPRAIRFSLPLSNSADWEGSYTVSGTIRVK